jgi:RNA polymerase sigma factor (sigma-70 family)
MATRTTSVAKVNSRRVPVAFMLVADDEVGSPNEPKPIVEKQEILDLLADARRGNAQAFETLLKQYIPLIQSFVFRVEPRFREELESRLIESFRTVVFGDAGDKYHPLGSPAYNPEYGITFYRFLEPRLHSRFSSYVTSFTPEPVPLPEGPSGSEVLLGDVPAPEETLMAQELRARVRKAVDQLPRAQDKDLVMMYFGFEPYDAPMTYEDIGKKLGITKSGVRQNLMVVLKRLSDMPEIRNAAKKARMAHLLREARKVALIFGDPIPMMEVPLSSVPAEVAMA